MIVNLDMSSNISFCHVLIFSLYMCSCSFHRWAVPATPGAADTDAEAAAWTGSATAAGWQHSHH